MPETRRQEDYREPLVQAAAEFLDAGRQNHAEVVEMLPADGKLVIQMDVAPVVQAGQAVPIPNKDPDAND